MKSLRILAVEDNAADFRLLTEYLREDPSSLFEVVRAGTLKEALARLMGEEFAAVLLDLNLPDGSGLDLLGRITTSKPATPVIVLTGADHPAVGLQALSKKAQDYLIKGQIDSNSLVRSIRYAIERNKAEEAARQMNVELAQRAADIQSANDALQASRTAALNLMEDALEARNKAERISAELLKEITERKMAQQALVESEYRYRNLFTNMSEGFALHEIVCDDDGRPVDYVFLEVNPAFEKLTGLKREQVLGKRVREAMPLMEDLWIEKYGQVAMTGEPCHFESFSAPLQRWFSVFAYCPDKGQFAVVFADVTDVMKAQEREREALAMTTAARTALDALEAMGEGVLVMDMDSIVRSVNPALEQMAGYQEQEIQGKTLVEVIGMVVAKEDQHTALAGLRIALQGKPMTMRPLTFVSRNGFRIPVILATSFIQAPYGKPTAFVVTVRDISELRGTYQALEESERKYRELVESANSIILRITPDQNILFFNEYAQSFFGYEENELLGKNVVGTIVPPVDSTGRDMKALMSAISENTVAFASNENENMRKDGRRVWVHWTNRAVRDGAGTICEILCVGVDVTQRKRLEMERERYQQRLRELAERLASTEERERRRISTQIHDTVIQTLSLSNIKLGSVRKELFDAGLTDRAGEVNSARSLIEDAIKESRSLMAELTPPLLYELGLVPALQDLTQRLEKQHRIPIRVHDDGEPKPLEKPIQGSLFEVTRELVVNALKHAGQCAITINLLRENDHLRICVSDNGAGFTAPEDGRFVFHRSGGFGLFSIRERLDQIGGKLTIESQPGKGTTANILMPLKSKG